jgi:hypothetical protein
MNVPDPAEDYEYREWLAEHPDAECLFQDECTQRMYDGCRRRVCEEKEEIDGRVY